MAPTQHDNVTRSDSTDSTDSTANAVPFDGGRDPSDLAGTGDGSNASAIEIGVIVAVVIMLLVTVAGVFVWRVRKNKTAKKAARSAHDTNVNGHQLSISHSQQPTPVPKDDSIINSMDHGTRDTVEKGRGNAPLASWSKAFRPGRYHRCEFSFE